MATRLTREAGRAIRGRSEARDAASPQHRSIALANPTVERASQDPSLDTEFQTHAGQVMRQLRFNPSSTYLSSAAVLSCRPLLRQQIPHRWRILRTTTVRQSLVSPA